MTRPSVSSPAKRLIFPLVALGMLELFGPVFLTSPALADEERDAFHLEKSPAVKANGTLDQTTKDRRKRQALTSMNQPDEIDFDAEATKKRDEQIQTLTKVIPKAQGLAKADLLFRLAELWWEKSRKASQEAVLAYDQALEEWLKAAEKDESAAGAPPALDDFLSDSELFRHEALRTYGSILEGWPTYPRRDEVLFADAYNKAQLGRKSEAATGYRQLISEFPQSRFTFDALVQLGEIEFDLGHLALARQAYEQALATPATALRTFARYRLAWCDFNAGDDAQGVARLKEVVAESGPSGLMNEAMNDLVSGFARLEDVRGAIDWFESQKNLGRIDQKKERQLIRKTASILVKDGKSKAGREGFLWLIDSDKNDEAAPEDLRAIVDSYEAERDRDNVLKYLFHLGRHYGPNSDWAQANAGNKDVLQRAYHVGESAMRTLVADYHDEALRTKSAATYRVARDIYGEYLALYPDSASAPELAFFHGEILWALEEFEQAGGQYALSFSKAPNGKHAQSAAYNAVLAFEKALALEEKSNLKRTLADDARVDETAKKAALTKGHKQAILREAQRRQPSEKSENRSETTADSKHDALSNLEANLVHAIDQFSQAFPSDPEAVAARYRAAHLLVKSGDEVEAARRLGTIIGDFPKDPWSRKAVTLTLDLLEKRGAWLALHEEAKKFSAAQALVHGDKSFQHRMEELSVGALYKHFDEVVLADPNGGRARAAKGLEDLAHDHPTSQYAPKATFHAMNLYEADGASNQAFSLEQKFLEHWPNDSTSVDGMVLSHEVKRRVATHLFQRGKIAESEAMFSRYLDEIPPHSAQKTTTLPLKATASDGGLNDEPLSQALFLAAISAKALGNTKDDTSEAAQFRKKAIQRFREFADRFPNHPDSTQALFSALGLEATNSPEKAATQALNLMKSTSGKVPSPRLRLQWLSEVAHWLSHHSAQASQSAQMLLAQTSAASTAIFQALSESEKSSDEAKDAFGAVQFLLSEQDFQRAISIDFSEENASVRKLQATLTDKVNRVGKLEAAYLELASLGSKKWSLAALTRLGQLYGDLAKKILDSPDPQGLTDEEKDQYREALEAQAFPLEEKAMNALNSAVEKAMELSAYGPWILEAQMALQELKPSVFPPIHDEKFHLFSPRPPGAEVLNSPQKSSFTNEATGKGGDAS